MTIGSQSDLASVLDSEVVYCRFGDSDEGVVPAYYESSLYEYEDEIGVELNASDIYCESPGFNYNFSHYIDIENSNSTAIVQFQISSNQIDWTEPLVFIYNLDVNLSYV